MNRACGNCSACCSLLPVKGLGKGANVRCQHQSHARGCKVYHRAGFPLECSLWSCQWLACPESTAKLSRPDRSGYVIDVVPDFISIRDDETGEIQQVQVVQVWCDPKRRDAHKDPHLREFLSRQADQMVVALIRYSDVEAFVLFAPQFTGGRGWQENHPNMRAVEHTPQEIAEAISTARGEDWIVKDLSKEKT